MAIIDDTLSLTLNVDKNKLNTFNKLQDIFGIDSALASKVMNFLTIDAGTADYISQLYNYAQTLWTDIRGKYDQPRKVFFRLKNAVENELIPNKDGYIQFKDSVFGEPYSLHILEVKRMKMTLVTVSEKSIKHYVKPEFDQFVFAELGLVCNERWLRDRKVPEGAYDEYDFKKAQEKLQEALNQRYPNNKTLAARIFNEIREHELDRIDLELAIERLADIQKRVSVGAYDPPYTFHPQSSFSEVWLEPTQPLATSNNSAIFLHIAAGLSVFGILLLCLRRPISYLLKHRFYPSSENASTPSAHGLRPDLEQGRKARKFVS